MAGDHRFASITEIWLDGDHYKWLRDARQRRERTLLHGRRVGLEKFEAWRARCPTRCANPLYH